MVKGKGSEILYEVSPLTQLPTSTQSLGEGNSAHEPVWKLILEEEKNEHSFPQS